ERHEPTFAVGAILLVGRAAPIELRLEGRIECLDGREKRSRIREDLVSRPDADEVVETVNAEFHVQARSEVESELGSKLVGFLVAEGLAVDEIPRVAVFLVRAGRNPDREPIRHRTAERTLAGKAVALP